MIIGDNGVSRICVPGCSQFKIYQIWFFYCVLNPVYFAIENRTMGLYTSPGSPVYDQTHPEQRLFGSIGVLSITHTSGSFFRSDQFESWIIMDLPSAPGEKDILDAETIGTITIDNPNIRAIIISGLFTSIENMLSKSKIF